MSFPKIDGYLVVEKLGFGSYSNVYKAFSKKSDRDQVAIKCIERSLMKGSAVDNLITEISLLKTFKHPHIVLMKDFQWDDKYVYIVMEYCNYGDLSKYLKREKGIEERACRQLLRQLALALQHLRERGVVHMDLKPQNLLLHKSGSGEIILKIADFGFAQYMSEETRMKSLRGSPLYMAPEVFQLGMDSKQEAVKKGYDAKVDLWSVGVILYECLFGKAPYSSTSYKELVDKIVASKKIEIPERSVSQDCKDMLTGLLQHDPVARMSYEEFFSHAFLDMKHMPSPENYKKAVDLVQRAVAKDSSRDYEAAYHLYCESLRYFVPMVTEEVDRRKKDQLRAKVNCYIKRAEELKLFTVCSDGPNMPSVGHKRDKLRPRTVGNNVNSPHCSKRQVVDLTREDSVAIQRKKDSVVFKRSVNTGETSSASNVDVPKMTGCEEETDVSVPVPVYVENGELKRYTELSRVKFEQLYALCASTSLLQTGLESGLSAEMYVREGKLEEALNLYSSALAILLKGCQQEPLGHRRNMLADKIEEWLREAESIKALLESREMQHDLGEDVHREYCRIQ